MYEELSFLDINQKGEYIFVYSDKYNIFFILKDDSEKKLYKITTNKDLIIEYIAEIKTPDNFFTALEVKFHKPILKRSEYNFVGIAVFKDSAFKFCINDRETLEYNKEQKYTVNDGIVNTLQCLDSVTVKAYIQKKETVYVIGYDKECQDYIFAAIDVNDDKFEKIYSLFTDYGDIIPMSIGIDADERTAYVVGKLVNEKQKTVKPYFETFLL